MVEPQQSPPVYDVTAAALPADRASSMSALSSFASLSLSQPNDAASTDEPLASSAITPKHADNTSSSPSAVQQFNVVIRQIKQLKKHTCPDHVGDSTKHTDSSAAASDTCHCHQLLRLYQQALTLATAINTTSSAATRQQLLDRIAHLNSRLLPQTERIDERYTLHRQPNHYALNIPHLTQRYHMPAALYDRLYDYQRESVHWLCRLHADGTGGILGDDMGLGKTVQVSALLGVLFHSRLVHHVLLVVPTSLIDNWRAELTKWCPALPLHLYTDTPERRARKLQQCLHTGGILLSSYGVLSSLQHAAFDALILDEGHRIKNADTQQTRQVKAIQCGYRVLCTGTVVQNRLTELWCLMDFVCCGRLLGDRREFKEHWSDVIEEGKHKGASVEARRLSDELSRRLSELIRPYIMRRTKEEIKARHAKQRLQQQQQEAEAAASGAMSVPQQPSAAVPELRVQKNELVVWLYPSEAQRRLYTALLSSGSEVMKHAQNAINLKRRPLDAMSLLRTLCSHPRLVRANHKLCVGLPADVLVRQVVDAAEKAELIVAESEKVRMLLELLDEHRRGGHRTLVFSWSVQMLDLISLVLQHRNINYLRIDGQVPPAKRTAIIEAFRQPACPASVFLLTTGVGGVGLNLTSADRCVLLDPDWNPATDAQSIDRCYRIGQVRNVVVYRFVTIGTIEEIVYRKQVFKQSLIRLVDGSRQAAADERRAEAGGLMDGEDGSGGAQFTREELRGMFKQQDYSDSRTQRQLSTMYPPHLRRSYPKLDDHIDQLHRLGIFGLTDHDLLFDHTANANRRAPAGDVDADEADDPMRRERAAAAAKHARQMAEAMTDRLQHFIPQPPAWPSTRRGEHHEDDGDVESGGAAGEEDDWRDAERRKEREEEKTAEWIDGDEAEADNDVDSAYAPFAADREDHDEQESTGQLHSDATASEASEEGYGQQVSGGGEQDEERSSSPASSGKHSNQPAVESVADSHDSHHAPTADVEADGSEKEADEHEEDGEQFCGHDSEEGGGQQHSPPAHHTHSGELGEDAALCEVEGEQPRRELPTQSAGEVDDGQHDSGANDSMQSGDDSAEQATESHIQAAEENSEDEEAEAEQSDCGEENEQNEEEGVEENKDEDEEAEAEYEVEAILDKRRMHGRIEYRVRWLGYGEEHDSWQSEDSLDCDELVQEYEQRVRAGQSADEADDGTQSGCGEDGDWMVDDEAVEDDQGESCDASEVQQQEEEELSVREADEGSRIEEVADIREHTDAKHSTASPQLAAHPTMEDEEQALADEIASLRLQSPRAVFDHEEQPRTDEEACTDASDEQIEWDEAVEWAADSKPSPPKPSTPPSADAVASATPVRLHVHSSIAGISDMHDGLLSPDPSYSSTPDKHAPKPSSSSSPIVSPVSQQHSHPVQRAVQLVHNSLHPTRSSHPVDSLEAMHCCCALRDALPLHRLSELTVDEAEDVLELLIDALHTPGHGEGGWCESVMEVAMVLMERLEHEFAVGEVRRPQGHGVSGAGVRRWLCV